MTDVIIPADLTWSADPIWLICWSANLADQLIIFFKNKFLKETFFKWSDQLAWAKLLSIDFSDIYLISPHQSSVLWSFRYVMSKYCQLIFQTNTWLAWAKLFSADLSDKYMIANKYLTCDKYFICDRFFNCEIIYWRSWSIELL